MGVRKNYSMGKTGCQAVRFSPKNTLMYEIATDFQSFSVIGGFTLAR